MLFDTLPDQKPRRKAPIASADTLLALAGLGAPKDLIAMFLESEDLHPDHRRFLLGPIIQHRSPWMDITPTWLLEAVTASRLRLIVPEHAEGKVGWQVGSEEITAVMMPATMDAPMSMECTDLYLWASAQSCARHYGRTLDDMWQQIGGHVVTDADVTAPGGRYHHTYRELCSDIRRRVVKAQTDRERATRTQHRASSTKPQSEQFSLF